MSIDEFWMLVGRVHSASGGDMEAKCGLLADELRRLSAEEVQSFDEHFNDCVYRAYHWDVWGAAFVINDGCGDDGFFDFRSTLVSLGRAPFEAALADADSLAGFEIDPEWAEYEGYQYVAPEVYTELTGHFEIPGSANHPKRPAGVRFIEWELSLRFPRLAAKHKFKDLDWIYLKEAEEKRFRNQQIADRVAKLLLESGIIPSSGLIPPFRVVAGVLRTGRAPESSGRQLTWEPFELDEGDYWRTVERLMELSVEERKARLDLQSITLRRDSGGPVVESYEDWIGSLRDRGPG